MIGTDGGLVPTPYETPRLLISPGERYDVLVLIDGAPGAQIPLVNEAYDRGHGSADASPTDLMTFTFTAEPKVAPPAAYVPSANVERLEARPADFTLDFDEEVRGDTVVFTINGKAHPEVPMIHVPLGEVRAFDVTNTSVMDHPFHLHGSSSRCSSVTARSPLQSA